MLILADTDNMVKNELNAIIFNLTGTTAYYGVINYIQGAHLVRTTGSSNSPFTIIGGKKYYLIKQNFLNSN